MKDHKGLIYIRPGGPKPTAAQLETCEAVVVVSEPFQPNKPIMRKTTASPDGLLHRAGRCVTRVEVQLGVLSEVLATLQRVINQGDVAVEDPDDITARLRWVEHKEAELARSLDSVTAKTSELMRQLDATCSPEVFTPLQVPPGDQPALSSL